MFDRVLNKVKVKADPKLLPTWQILGKTSNQNTTLKS